MDLHRRFPIPLRYLRRSAQVILPKDFGAIVAYTGLSKEWEVIEGGSGSGFLTVQLARIAKRVHSYEINDERFNLIKSNLREAGVDNVELNNSSIDMFSGEPVNLIVLDMKDSDNYIKFAYDNLSEKGYLVGYLPNTDQLKRFYLESEKYFREVFAIEVYNREWEVRNYGARPKHIGLQHTAFLVFAVK